MKTIAIKLPDDLLAAIQFVAKKRGETRSAVMREALQEFLSKNRNTGSCLDLPVILPDVWMDRRIFRRIRPTWMITGDETAGHPGYWSIGSLSQFAGQVPRLGRGPISPFLPGVPYLPSQKYRSVCIGIRAHCFFDHLRLGGFPDAR